MTYADQVLLGGAFPVLRDKTIQEEMEGRFEAAESLADNAYMVLSQIQELVPPEQQADVTAEFLRESGFSSDVVTQMLGIPRDAVDAALMAAGYDAFGQPLPEEDVFADTTKNEITVDDISEPFVGPLKPEGNGISMVDLIPEVEGVVTDDPNQIWKDTDKDELDLKGFIDLAFDVFGAYNKDAITNVVDLVNQRGISVQEVAQATGNSVESINQAATESGVAIQNQGVSDDPGGNGGGDGDGAGTGDGAGNGDGVGDGVGDTDGNGAGDTAGDGAEDTAGTPTGTTGTPTKTPSGEPDDEPSGGGGIFNGPLGDDTPPPETPIQILTETPTPQPTPQPTPRMGMLALIQSTPVTEQMFSRELFEPKLKKLNNVAQALGMLQSIGRRF
jgi:hypothetical protein